MESTLAPYATQYCLLHIKECWKGQPSTFKQV